MPIRDMLTQYIENMNLRVTKEATSACEEDRIWEDDENGTVLDDKEG